MSTPDIKFQNEVIEHIETMTHQMTESFKAVNARLDHITARIERIEETHTYHKEILLNHGQMLRDHGELLRQILSTVQQKPIE
jgi:phage shock protein A